MNLAFDPERHLYTIDGAPAAGVTAVLSAAGLVAGEEWFKPEHRDRGHAVHLACQYINDGTWDRAETHPAIVPYADGYAEFLAATGFKAKLQEQAVGSKAYMLAGTLDLWGICNGETWLPDIKSSSTKPGLSASIQEALYEYCLIETLKKSSNRIVTVWLPGNGKYRLIDPKYSYKRLLQWGLEATSLYWLRKNEGLI